MQNDLAYIVKKINRVTTFGALLTGRPFVLANPESFLANKGMIKTERQLEYFRNRVMIKIDKNFCQPIDDERRYRYDSSVEVNEVCLISNYQ